VARGAGGEVVVFAGPTISREEIEDLIPATVLGPARRGDVYLATRSDPWAIAIVDGFFDQTPALWHKEILWALSLGIRVFGSSSLGALRAAELSRFGMEGVGEIYDAYASGELCADDEVAVAHATEGHGFKPLSDALVNIRWTLRAAERGGVLGPASRLSLEEIARASFYPERSFGRVVREARNLPIDSEDLQALERWLPGGKVDQKRNDARTMLVLVAQERGSARPRSAGLSFPLTEAWNRLRATLDQGLIRASEPRPAAESRGSRERDPLPTSVREGAILRAIAAREAKTQRTRLAPGAVDLVVETFRRERGLLSAEAFAEWIAGNFGSEREVTQFFVEETLVRALKAGYEGSAVSHLRNERIAAAPWPRPDTAAGPDKPPSPERCDSSERSAAAGAPAVEAVVAGAGSANRSGS